MGKFKGREKEKQCFSKAYISQKKKNKDRIVKDYLQLYGIPGGSVAKESARDLGLILELGRPSGERRGNPLQYSYLGSPMDRGAWQGYDLWGHERQI